VARSHSSCIATTPDSHTKPHHHRTTFLYARGFFLRRQLRSSPSEKDVLLSLTQSSSKNKALCMLKALHNLPLRSCLPRERHQYRIPSVIIDSPSRWSTLHSTTNATRHTCTNALPKTFKHIRLSRSTAPYSSQQGKEQNNLITHFTANPVEVRSACPSIACRLTHTPRSLALISTRSLACIHSDYYRRIRSAL
jgi:hypothetical protein